MVKEHEKADVMDQDVQTWLREKPYQRYIDAALGLRDHWYPAIFSHEVEEGKTKAETIAGERLYFKRVDGQVYCIEDRCAHRGVQFSRRPEVYSKNTITCWFHGFCYDVRDGKLVSVLTEPNSSVVGKISIKTYPIFEQHGVVFVFIGDMDPPPPIQEDMQPTFWTPNLYVRPLVRYKIRCNWRLAAENGFDQGHLYLHRFWASAQRYFGPQGFLDGMIPGFPLGTSPAHKGEVRLQEEPGGPKGIYVGGSIASWVGEVEGVKVHGGGIDPDNPPPTNGNPYPEKFGCFLPCGLDVPGWPRPDLFHIEWFVPIDEDNHYYTIIQGKVCETDEEKRAFDKEVDDYLARDVFVDDPTADPLGLGPNPGGFNNADAFGREGVHHSYRNEDWFYRERLYKPDYSVLQWRMLVHRNARGIQKRGNFARLDE